MSKIKTGELTTKELVNIFGTSKLNKKYEDTKHISGRDKELLLIKAEKFCDIEDLGKGRFIIHKVYNMTRDDLILPMKKGLYKYLTPLVLTKLLDEQDENYKITLPFLGWARKFEIINDNYSLIKYYQDQGSKYLGISEDVMFEYFEKIDECIKYYLNECLSTLSKKTGLDLLEFDYVTMVKKGIVASEKNNNGGMDITCKYIDEVISDDDRKFVIDCENEARIRAGIESPKEKFYGAKSYMYKKEFKKLLSERNILFTYTAYNIFCKNKDRVKDVIDKFSGDENIYSTKFVNEFNEKFIEYVNKKAKNRHVKEVEKLENNIDVKFLQEHRLLETYIKEFYKLTEITLNKEYENLYSHFKIEDTMEAIMSEFKINILKK